MYILTLEERLVRDQSWYKTYRIFESKENARDYMECLYETEGVRSIRLWEADEVPHKCKLSAKVSFNGE